MAEDKFDMEDFTDLDMGTVSEETKGDLLFCNEGEGSSSDSSSPC